MEQGQVETLEYQIFPGIRLFLRRAEAASFQKYPGLSRGMIEIAHCRDGRLEYEGKDRFFFLNPGDMTIHRVSAGRAVLHCPTGRYCGLSVVIDPAEAPRCTSCLLGDVDVELPSLFQKLLEGDQPLILRATPRLEHIFSEIYEVPEPLRKGYYKVKVLELLLFLSCLEPNMSQLKQHTYSKEHIRIAGQVFDYVERNRGRHLTARELAGAVHMSPGQLRRSMVSVYGKTLYQCVRSYKMRLAAAELLESGRTVMDIASEFGYDNSSKFAAAFQTVMGCSPAEYRAGSGGAGEIPDLLERKTERLERKELP